MKIGEWTIFKGWKAPRGPVHMMNIKLRHLRAVFFPQNFTERYSYLGAVPWNEDGPIFKAMEPLVIFMDYRARPKWCPKWFLRFLHLFGSDNSIVRVRNYRLHKLEKRITKGIMIWDYKTKWTEYDLRISVAGDNQIQDLAMDIERCYYRRGLRADLMERLEKLDPEEAKGYYGTLEDLSELVNNLENEKKKEDGKPKKNK